MTKLYDHKKDIEKFENVKKCIMHILAHNDNESMIGKFANHANLSCFGHQHQKKIMQNFLH